MTLKEKKSKRKAEALRYMVDKGEYSPAFALMEAERLNDEGKLLDVDYEPLAEYLEELMNKEDEEPTQEEPIEEYEEISEVE